MATLIYKEIKKHKGRKYYYPPVDYSKTKGDYFCCPMIFEYLDSMGKGFKSQKIDEIDENTDDPFIHFQIEWQRLPREDGVVCVNPEDLFDDIFEKIDDEAKKLIKSRRLRVVISDMLNHNSVVGDQGEKNLILRIQKSANKHNIPGNLVKFISGDYTTDKRWKDYVKDNNITNPIKCEYVALQGTFYRNTDPIDHSDFIDPKDRNLEKLYLSLNRKPRIQRVLALSLMEKHNLLDKGFVSAIRNVNVKPRKKTFDELIEILKNRDAPDNKRILTEDVFSCAEQVKNRLPMLLDIEDLADVKPILSDHFIQSIDYYNKSFCSVVIESTYRDCGTYLTQNIFKSIAAKHPFFIVGQKGLLKNLKHLGFKTFDEFFDEKYDNKTNYVRRVDAMIKELAKLGDLKTDELKGILADMSDILEYNHDYYFSDFQNLILKQIEEGVLTK